MLARAEVVIYDRLVNRRLVDLAPPKAERIFVGKHAPEEGGSGFSQRQINDLLIARAREGKRVVRLKGGDPFVFGRGGEEAEALVAAGVPFEVVPGVTSAIAAPAYAGIPVTHRRLSSSFTVVTGHEDPEKAESAVDSQAHREERRHARHPDGRREPGRHLKLLVDGGRSPASPSPSSAGARRPTSASLPPPSMILQPA